MRSLTVWELCNVPERATHYTIGDNGLACYFFNPTKALSVGLELREIPKEFQT